MFLLMNEALVLGWTRFPLVLNDSMTTSNYSSLDDFKRFAVAFCVLLKFDPPLK